MKIAPPNYTQIPNEFLDNWLPLLKEIELKVLLAIMRKTLGWQKTKDRISISQLQKLTGSSPQNILKAVDVLVGFGIVKKEVFGKKGKQETYYELIFSGDKNNPTTDNLSVEPLINYQGNPSQIISGTPNNLSVTKETIQKNDLKDIFIKNDNDNLESKSPENFIVDRSFDKFPSIVSFDPETYIFPDGSKISKRMKNSIAKYSAKDREKLRANVFYMESQIQKGKKPKDSYEQWLQGCIKFDYASKEEAVERNRMYALFIRDAYNIRGIGVMNTVVKLNNFTNEPPKSITLSLPHESFCAIIDSYVRLEENKG